MRLKFGTVSWAVSPDNSDLNKIEVYFLCVRVKVGKAVPSTAVPPRSARGFHVEAADSYTAG